MYSDYSVKKIQPRGRWSKERCQKKAFRSDRSRRTLLSRRPVSSVAMVLLLCLFGLSETRETVVSTSKDSVGQKLRIWLPTPVLKKLW